jgi:hypothetical protein
MKECRECWPVLDEYGWKHQPKCSAWMSEWRRRSIKKQVGKDLTGDVRP